MSDAALTDLFKGLAMNNLDGAYDYVVTGYIGRADTLKSVLSAVQSLRNKVPHHSSTVHKHSPYLRLSPLMCKVLLACVLDTF